MAVLNILMPSCLDRSSMAAIASYMIRSAVDFLPRSIMMLMNFVTSRLPNFGSGSTSRLAAPVRRMADSGSLGRLGAVLSSKGGSAPLPSLHPIGGAGKAGARTRHPPHRYAPLGALAPYFDRLCLRPAT